MYLHEKIYFSDIDDLVDQWLYSVDNILDLPKDFTLEVKVCKQVPLYEFTTEKIVDNIPEDSLPEEGFLEYLEEIREVVEASVDLEVVNRRMPKMWVPTEEFKIFTREDFLQTLN